MYWQVYDLKRKYALKVSTYLAMLRRQGGRCAVCGTNQPSPRPDVVLFAADHNHHTGKVRGLLCFNCNVQLGVYEVVAANPAMMAYLSRSN